MRKLPPKKQHGTGEGERKINGLALDVRTGSAFLGWSEKKTRGMIERGLIPHRRCYGRIVLLRSELEMWLGNFPDVTVEEARANREARQ